MHERNGIDQARPGAPLPAQRDNGGDPPAAPGRESLAWIRALANAWEDDLHQDPMEEPEGRPSVPGTRRSQ